MCTTLLIEKKNWKISFYSRVMTNLKSSKKCTPTILKFDAKNSKISDAVNGKRDIIDLKVRKLSNWSTNDGYQITQ